MKGASYGPATEMIHGGRGPCDLFDRDVRGRRCHRRLRLCIRTDRRGRLATHPDAPANRFAHHRLRSSGAGNLGLEAETIPTIAPPVPIPHPRPLRPPPNPPPSSIPP